MRAYKCVYADEAEFEMTLADAHKSAKEHAKGGEDWRDIQIEEVEVPTNKENIVNLMNGFGDIKPTGRRWGFKSARLGLEEAEE